ncbi:Copper transport protein family [Prunus dulcis]|uniref:Copper transport protein family n=1 Tax=Prunus dulcis TaxID=3755 RepID=A0A4Y1RLB5_PRUDU|nr:Copper transport protein family [Prunus dulcis]
MKQKIVVSVSKVSIEADKGHMEVIGDGVDSVCLTSLLRKKLGFATIVKVEEVKGAKDDKKEEKATPPPGAEISTGLMSNARGFSKEFPHMIMIAAFEKNL